MQESQKKNVSFDLTNDKVGLTSHIPSENQENKELSSLKNELAESKEEIKALKELVSKLLPAEEPDLVSVKSTDNLSERNESEENYFCSECGKFFAKAISLEAHVRLEHYEVKTFECKSCRKSYSNKENLWAHIAQNHGKKFDCDSCEKSFKTDQELKLHDDEDHTNNYDCVKCDHQSSSESLLNKHIEIKHSNNQRECKGVGSRQCGKNFKSYNDLMDHRRDDHNSGNKMCRYFKEGSCHFINSDKEKCWYLHKDTIDLSNDTKYDFDCKSCEKNFTSKNEVMNHRKDDHEDEVPPCKDFVAGKKCSRNRCWYSHRQQIGSSHVSRQVVNNTNHLATHITNSEGFWEHQTSKPPDQMIKIMEMITALTVEVSQIKMKFQQN